VRIRARRTCIPVIDGVVVARHLVVMRLLSIFVALGIAGCGGSSGVDGGLDASADDGGNVDAGASDAGPDGGGADAGCAERVTATIGSAGGTLVHCDGAILEVPPGAVEDGTELFIERAPTGPAISLPYVLAGAAFTFGPTDTVLTGRVRVVVPHDGGERMEMAIFVDDAWQLLEICESDETTVSQSFGVLGTFVAAHDPNEYPPGPSGLGTGSIEFTFGATDTIPIDMNGHAIDEDLGPGRSLTLLYRRSDDVGFEQVEARFGIDEDGAITPLQLSYYDAATGEIWSVLDLLNPGDLTIVITEDDGTAIAGTIDATLHLGEDTRAFTATFSASSVEWRYPPERVCDIPKG
jgi:hypothetical protein